MRVRTLYIFLSIFALLSCQTYKQGERLYEFHCSNCHMSDGGGLENLYPSLSTSDYQEFAPTFACIVRFGLRDTIEVNQVVFDIPMEGIPDLTEAELANIYNYIAYRWHPMLEMVSEQDITEMLENCEGQ